jgi:Protein of unknown function (DUF1552)
MSSNFTRRSFLGRSLATAAILDLPFLGRPRPAHAAPLYNAIFVYVPDGVVPSLWHPRGGETDFILPPMTEPLEPIRQSCVFLEGVAMHGGEPTHPGGTKKVLTATGPQSLDIFLGARLKGSAPFDSLQLGVQSNFENGSGTISYVGPGQEVKPDDNPLNVFDRVFGGAQPGGAPVVGADLRDRQRRSVLDAIHGDLTALQSKLGTAEKSRLDIHLQSLRDVEARATATMITPAMTGARTCDTAGFNGVGLVVPPNDYNYPQVYDRPENFTLVGQLQMDLAVLALSCNMTRVVTLMWSHAVSSTKLPGLTTVANHDASHYGVNPTNENARQFTIFKRYFMERLVSLVNALQRTPAAEGSVFDTTVIFLCSDISDGDLHDHRSLPFVVIGGPRTGLRGGRYLDFTGKGQGGENETHAKVLVSIARAVGVPIDSFGYTALGTGPLPGLFA